LSIQFSDRLAHFRASDCAQREAVTQINRGIERETLRITPAGKLATSMHPKSLGSTLTHPLITADHAEALLEFITPVETSIETTLAQLRDIHRFTYQNIGDELLWPLSMPCYVNDTSDIRLAHYGDSHIGKMKTTYRQGLTHRYGAVMQTIAGVHFNWSVSDAMWAELAKQDQVEDSTDYRSDRYFGLIRNFKRWAWVIPYFFGASPVLCKSFLKHSYAELDFHELGGGMVYVPYATSLRMSDLGYTNKEQAALKISYNSIEDYVAGLRRAVFTRSESFADIGVRDGEQWNQLNANILQIENEFYSPIRPKRVAELGETPTQALERGGVQYIEVRAIDVNPYSSVGITAEQMRFLDLFLLYCLWADSPALSLEQQRLTEANVNRVVLKGREPGLSLNDELGEFSIQSRLRQLFDNLEQLATWLDPDDAADYQQALAALVPAIENPELTLSAKLLANYRQAVEEYRQVGLGLAVKYQQELVSSDLEYYSLTDFKAMAEQSLEEQEAIEDADRGTFAEFLENYFLRALDKKNAPSKGA